MLKVHFLGETEEAFTSKSSSKSVTKVLDDEEEPVYQPKSSAKSSYNTEEESESPVDDRIHDILKDL
jgi:hypothetical protein